MRQHRHYWRHHYSHRQGRGCAGIGGGSVTSHKTSSGYISIIGGTVEATGGDSAAGIGSGSGSLINNNITSSVCGPISITGGTVNATSGDDAAGIGSGSYGKFDRINIGSGITRVTATRCNDNNVPIGKGANDQGSGAVTIDGVDLNDKQLEGTANLPTFTNLKVSISSDPDNASFTNKTWTITKK